MTATMNPHKILPFKSRLCYIQCRPEHRITPRRGKNKVMRQGCKTLPRIDAAAKDG
jgi:hypothetical protein